MAILIAYTNAGNGLAVQAAYARIDDFTFQLSTNTATLNVSIYASAAAAAAGLQPLEQDTITLSLQEVQTLGNQILARLYTALANRAPFSGGTSA